MLHSVFNIVVRKNRDDHDDEWQKFVEEVTGHGGGCKEMGCMKPMSADGH